MYPPELTSPEFATADSPRWPVFVTVVAIVDLVLCSLRIFAVLLGVVGAVAGVPNPLRSTLPWELGAGAGIVVFGVPADILLLLRRRVSIPFAWLNIAFTTASMGVAVWQASLMAGEGMGEVELAGFIVGAGGTLLFRLALLVLYLVAVGKARAFFAAHSQAIPNVFRPT